MQQDNPFGFEFTNFMKLQLIPRMFWGCFAIFCMFGFLTGNQEQSTYLLIAGTVIWVFLKMISEAITAVITWKTLKGMEKGIAPYDPIEQNEKNNI